MQVYELITCVRRANENAGNLISLVQFLIYIYFFLDENVFENGCIYIYIYIYLFIYLLYGKLCERAVCGEFCVLIGYPSGQDGAILPARDYPFRSRK